MQNYKISKTFVEGEAMRKKFQLLATEYNNCNFHAVCSSVREMITMRNEIIEALREIGIVFNETASSYGILRFVGVSCKFILIQYTDKFTVRGYRFFIPIIFTNEAFEKIAKEDLEQIYNRRYQPDEDIKIIVCII